MSLLEFEWIGGRQKAANVPLLSVENLTVRLGQRLVLDSVNVDLYEGEHLRVTGPNGSGKSTLFNAITGVVPVEEGRIMFDGRDITSLPTHERSHLGIRYMRQRENIFPTLTVRENLQLAVGVNGYERFHEEFSEWAKDIPSDRSGGMLSGGQRQKLAWGMVKLTNLRVILADEPFAGTSDFELEKTGLTLCVIEHQLLR